MTITDSAPRSAIYINNLDILHPLTPTSLIILLPASSQAKPEIEVYIEVTENILGPCPDNPS